VYRVAASHLMLVARDIATGFMLMSRVVVTLVGCVTLISAAAVYSNEAARSRFAEVVPAMFAGWLTHPAVTAEAVRSGDAGREPLAAGAEVDVVPEQRNVTRYLARRYRVADEAVRVLVSAAYRAGEAHSLDPLLILAVMAVESSMNPFAESAVGAQGLMQVMTRVHAEKFEPHGGDLAALDPVANIMVGSAILQDLIKRGGSVERGLQLYVGAGNLPDDGGYGGRVLGERARIELAATGKVEAALSSALRADAARADLRPASAAQAPEAALTVPASTPSGSQSKGGTAADQTA
jgi:soluble lytic murein transglycosylase-like protein